MMLTTVPFYRIERDEDGRPSREFDRLFTLALRWWPEIEIPDEWVSSASRAAMRADKHALPRHAGEVALRLLSQANDISQYQLDAAFAYLNAAIAWYESDPAEPYTARNAEAVGNLRDLLDELEG